MNASQVIDDIIALPPEEQAKVLRFTRRLKTQTALTGKELTALAENLAESKDPNRSAALRAAIKSGFYGTKPHAKG